MLCLCFGDGFFITEAVVCSAEIDQFLRIFHVYTGTDPFTLNIRSDRAADIGTFIVFQTAVPHRVVDNICSTFHESALIGIFDPENEYALRILLGDQICPEGSSEISDMHIAGRTRRKSSTNAHVFTSYIYIMRF